MQPPRAAACTRAHRAAAPRRALRTPAWPAWAHSGHARPPRPVPTRQPGSATDLPPTNVTSAASPAPDLLDRRPSRSTARQPTGTSTRSCGHGRPATATWSPTPPSEVGGDGRVRTEGVDTGRLDTGRLASRIPDAEPDGWTPHAGHRRPTPWLACWQFRSRRRCPTAGCRHEAPPGRRRLGEQQPGPLGSKDSEGTYAATDGPGHRSDQAAAWCRTVQAAPRCTAVLGRCRVERRAEGSRSSVMESVMRWPRRRGVSGRTLASEARSVACQRDGTGVLP
jgi:hypothetical protein